MSIESCFKRRERAKKRADRRGEITLLNVLASSERNYSERNNIMLRKIVSSMHAYLHESAFQEYTRELGQRLENASFS